MPTGSMVAKVLRLLILTAAAGAILLAAVPASAADGGWPKYLHDNGGSGYAAQAGITPQTAAQLKPVANWPVALKSTISTQPVLANGLIYVGAWDGYEYALTPSGRLQWKRFLGITTKGKACQYPIGIAGTALIASASVGGRTRSVLYVGGGGNADAGGKTFGGGTAKLFALDALTGELLWRTSLGSSPDHFIWSSPAYFARGSSNGSVYIGVSAFADCPLIQGQLVQLDAASGAILHRFDVVPSGCTGGSIWGSPSIDEAEGAVYVATGNDDPCSVFGPQVGSSVRPKRAALAGGLTLLGLLLAGVAWPRPSIRGLFWGGIAAAIIGATGTGLLLIGPQLRQTEPYTQALVKLSASDLHVLGHWQIPAHETVFDSDFGSTPTLFSGTVTPGGQQRALVGIANKNGVYYVFDRAGLDRGPLARLRIATGGNPPTSGNGSISPSAFDGAHLYVGGGHISIGGAPAAGTVSAYDPNDLRAPLWRTGLSSGPVLGAVSAGAGLVVVGAGNAIVILDSATGSVISQTSAGGGSAARPSIFYGAASLGGGVLYQGDTSGNLYALAAGAAGP
jgi:outer membrane protein assembly factor BamB